MWNSFNSFQAFCCSRRLSFGIEAFVCRVFCFNVHFQGENSITTINDKDELFEAFEEFESVFREIEDDWVNEWLVVLFDFSLRLFFEIRAFTFIVSLFYSLFWSLEIGSFILATRTTIRNMNISPIKWVCQSWGCPISRGNSLSVRFFRCFYWVKTWPFWRIDLLRDF